MATSTQLLPLDPPAQLVIARQDHIYDLTVTLPPRSQAYTPGLTKVYLRRKYPDYLSAELQADPVSSNRVHVRFAMNPAYEHQYEIVVHNYRGSDKDYDVLFFGKLTDVPRSTK